MSTTMRNDFHRTTYTTRKSREELNRIDSANPWNRTEAEKRFVRKVSAALCGIEGCTCGTNDYSERPRTD